MFEFYAFVRMLAWFLQAMIRGFVIAVGWLAKAVAFLIYTVLWLVSPSYRKRVQEEERVRLADPSGSESPDHGDHHDTA